MKIFNEFPKKAKCPICKTNKQGQCCLITVEGTQVGNNAEAVPCHIDCIDLWLYQMADGKIIYQSTKG